MPKAPARTSSVRVSAEEEEEEKEEEEEGNDDHHHPAPRRKRRPRHTAPNAEEKYGMLQLEDHGGGRASI